LVQRIIERGEIESLDHTALPRLLLPETAATVFTTRAVRLRDLAEGKVAGIAFNPAMSGYLEFIREVALAQAEIAKSLSDADLAMPDQQSLNLALDHMMPPLAAQLKRAPVWRTILNQLIDTLAGKIILNVQNSILFSLAYVN